MIPKVSGKQSNTQDLLHMMLGDEGCKLLDMKRKSSTRLGVFEDGDLRTHVD